MVLINYTNNKNATGIYCIRNLKNSKLYIGSTKKSFSSRKNRHFLNLKRGTHYNEHLQNSFKYYGENNFSFEVLFVCSPNECEKYEAEFIKLYSSQKRNCGYNIQSVTEYRFKYNMSKKHIAENSKRKINRGKVISGLESSEHGLPKQFNHYDISGKLISEYNSAIEYVSKHGGSRAHISNILTKRKLFFNNSIILFSNDTLNQNDISFAESKFEKRKKRKIEIYDLMNNYVTTLECATDAGKYLKCDGSAVRQCCIGTRNRIGNYKTKYETNE